MALLLTFLAIVVFFGGAYFMGNWVLDALHDDPRARAINTVFGFLIWFVIAILGVCFWGVYCLISSIL